MQKIVRLNQEVPEEIITTGTRWQLGLVVNQKRRTADRKYNRAGRKEGELPWKNVQAEEALRHCPCHCK